MRITYGDAGVDLAIPAKNLAAHVTPTGAQPRADVDAALAEAMDAADPTLAELAADKRLTLLVPDHTREQPTVAQAAACLRAAAAARRVRVLVATGSHAPAPEKNRALVEGIRASIAAAGRADTEVRIHDCMAAQFDDYGCTPHGTPVRVNRWANEADVFAVASDMKPHYFAGYSNALKFFLPGLAPFAATERNHALALDPTATYGYHPLHPQPDRRENPLARDMLDFFERFAQGRPAFVLATIAAARDVYWAGAGLLEETIARGIAEVDARMAHAVDPARYAIVSCGGYPNDETLYTAQRGLELTRAGYAPGARVLFLAECRNGIAPNDASYRNFYERLAQPLDEVLRTIEQDYKLYAHKAYKLGTLLRHTEAVHLTSSLAPEQVRAIHLQPSPSPQAVVDQWLTDNPQARILVFDQANKLAIQARGADGATA